MATDLDSLIKDLQNSTYKPKTQAELQQQAQNRYQSAYDQRRLDATQAQQQSDLALQHQAGRVGKLYDKQLDQSAQQYAQAYSQSARHQLSRGMQRSSYGAATLANIDIAGAKAADDIGQNKTDALGNIEQQRSLLAQQLADQLRSYSGQQAADVLAYMDDLEAREYDRGTQSQQYQNSLAMQIYQFAQQQKATDQAQANWLAEFNEGVRQFNERQVKSGGSSDNSGNTPPPVQNDLSGANNINSLLDDYLNSRNKLTVSKNEKDEKKKTTITTTRPGQSS